jgi:hypothetical protein
MQLGMSLADSLATQILFFDSTADDTQVQYIYTKGVSGTRGSYVEKPRLRQAFESPEL